MKSNCFSEEELFRMKFVEILFGPVKECGAVRAGSPRHGEGVSYISLPG